MINIHFSEIGFILVVWIYIAFGFLNNISEQFLHFQFFFSFCFESMELKIFYQNHQFMSKSKIILVQQSHSCSTSFIHINLQTSNFLLISDQEASSQPHQTTDERIHGLVSIRAKKDCGTLSRQTQCRDLKGIGQTMEAAQRDGQTALHRGG